MKQHISEEFSPSVAIIRFRNFFFVHIFRPDLENLQFSKNIVASCYTANTDNHKMKHFQKKNQSKPNKQRKNSYDSFTKISRIFQKSDRDVLFFRFVKN